MGRLLLNSYYYLHQMGINKCLQATCVAAATIHHSHTSLMADVLHHHVSIHLRNHSSNSPHSHSFYYTVLIPVGRLSGEKKGITLLFLFH